MKIPYNRTFHNCKDKFTIYNLLHFWEGWMKFIPALFFVNLFP